MMKKILVCILLIAASGTSLMAQDTTTAVPVADSYKFGLGLRLSNDAPSINNSITARYMLNEGQGLEALVSFGSNFGIGFLYEKFTPLGTSGFKWFYGAGAYVGFRAGDTYVGPQGVLGLDYKFPGVPVNVSLDWKPELDVIPTVNLVPDAFGLSARFTF
jgi:hypothetical protein